VKAPRFSYVVAQSVARALQLLISVVYLNKSHLHRNTAPSAIRSAMRWASIWSIAPRPRSGIDGRRALHEADADGERLVPQPHLGGAQLSVTHALHQHVEAALVG
jgi:hypothetical protein